MKNYRTIIALLLTALCLTYICMPFCAMAKDSIDNYDELIKEYDLSSFELIGEESKEFLNNIGISDFNYESISDISFTTVTKHIVNVILQRIDGPIKSGIILIGLIIISSFYCIVSKNLSNSNDSDIFAIAVNMIIAIYIVDKIMPCITLCSSTIKLCSDFTYAFFPVFCIIVATSGGTVTSFSVNTMLLALSQFLGAVSNFVFLPTTSCFMSLGLCSSINKELNLSALVNTIKSVITKSISIISAVFVSILSMKTAVSSKADVLGLRSVRFAINSVVPIIGGTISEGLLSIQSYSSLIKTSVGVVGIIAVFAVFLPALVDVTIWRFVLTVTRVCSLLFSHDSCADMIEVFRDVLLIINVIMILVMVTTIISIGILIAAKTGS